MKTRQMLCILSLILLTFVVKIYLELSDADNKDNIADLIEYFQYFGVLCCSILIGATYQLKV
jgi:predicted component of viral defense system (DUF524 family)